MIDFNGIDYLGIDRIVKRGSAEFIVRNERFVFVRDAVSGVLFLCGEVCDDDFALIDGYIDKERDALMVDSEELYKKVFKRYGFEDKLECYQVAYYGDVPKIDTELDVRVAEEADIPLIVRNYHLVGEDEIVKIVGRRALYLGFLDGEPVGFAGEHLEGSMGLLYVFPEFRRRGFGEALEKVCIAKTIEKGFLPFGQVEKNNVASLNLQKKLGFKISENLIFWMW